jgi:hypothetical protein
MERSIGTPDQTCKHFLLRCNILGVAFLEWPRGRMRPASLPFRPFVLPLPPGHSFPMPKYRLLREAVDALRCPATAGAGARRAGQRRRTGAGARAGWIGAVLQGTLSAARSSARSAFPGASAWWSARALGGRHHRAARAALAVARAWPPTWPVAPTTPSADKGSGYCVFNDVAVAARLMQAEWHRHGAPLLRVAGDRPRRAPGQRHGGHLPRRPHGVHAVAARREELPLPQGGQRPGRGTARRLRPTTELPGGAGRGAGAGSGRATGRRRPAWPSTWPAPTRTRATAWAG